jgi:hypothetical protein
MRGTEFEPTANERALVESAAASGLTQAEIATQLNIDETAENRPKKRKNMVRSMR